MIAGGAMKRSALFLVVLALAGFSTAAEASEWQKSLKSRWLGAWVVTTTEGYSDCNGTYTNNRINGNLVKSSGRQVFEAGELAKLDRVDAKRSRLDLHLSLIEPVLLDHRDGPFTLYREARCKIELEVVLPRSVVKSRDVDAVEEALGAILERHATASSAKDSLTWNERVREDYPEDYEETLVAHQIWQVTQTNDAVQAQLDRAYVAAEELSHRVKSEQEYIAGFARGVEDAQNEDLANCPRLLAVDMAGFKRRAAQAADDNPVAAMAARGFQDGRQLVYGLTMIQYLPNCFIPVPEVASADSGG
jgi:hypothetical protein